MHSEQAIQCVETLCERGCFAVRAIISAMEAGCDPVETAGLTEAQRRFVLEELKSIMAVYNRPCPVPTTAQSPATTAASTPAAATGATQTTTYQTTYKRAVAL